MITLQHTEELLSRAYLTAVAAKAGLNANIRGGDLDYGTDGNFKKVVVVENKRIETGFGIEYQAKATKNWRTTQNADEIVYDMPVDAYNRLITRSALGGIPIYLILLCLPDSAHDWVELSHEEMILRHCCYWQRISGAPTENDNTTAVHIPKSQRFDPYTLRLLVNEMEEQFS
ncbi:MAG: DUF4365 domain-containing protein [Opitutae bacterium]|nr:DUF4365 domain-containing protein [Opitutae bacterium]